MSELGFRSELQQTRVGTFAWNAFPKVRSTRTELDSTSLAHSCGRLSSKTDGVSSCT